MRNGLGYNLISWDVYDIFISDGHEYSRPWKKVNPDHISK